MPLQLLTYFRVNLMFIFFPSLFWHWAAVQWSLRMRSYKDPIRKSSTGDYAPSSSTGPRNMSSTCVKWYYLRAKSENVSIVAALSSRDVLCDILPQKWTKSNHHRIFFWCSSRFIVRFQHNCKRNLRAKSGKVHLVAVSSSRDCEWHFITNEQEVKITGFVWWSSRLRATFQYK